MPHILVHLPSGAFPGAARQALVRRIHDAAAEAEQLPPDPKRRFLCWVLVRELEPGAWTCGGADVTARVVPCFVQVHLPAGVLDAPGRARCVRLLDAALRQSWPADDPRVLATSVLLHEATDGTWGADGALWTLPDFAKAAGYAHLQHLVDG